MFKKWSVTFFAVLAVLALSSAKADRLSSAADYFGQPVYDAGGHLLYIAENSRQSHSQEEYVMIRVQNIKEKRRNETGRVMVALWDSSETYARPDILPFRHSFHWAKDAINHELVFKIGGLTPGNQYAFFAHFDKNNDGELNTMFGIPTEQYVFSNTANQGRGPGLTSEHLSAPKYKHTLVTYQYAGQEVLLPF